MTLNETFLKYCEYGEFEKLNSLLELHDLDINCPDADGCTGLHLAIGEKYREIVDLLIKKHADFHIKDNDGYSALHWAIFSDDEHFLDLVYQHNQNLEDQDKGGNRPIHISITHEAKRSLKWLIEKGVDIDAQDTDKYTALHCAACSNRVEYGKILLEAGASIHAINNRGEVPLETALRTEKLEFANFLKSVRSVVQEQFNKHDFKKAFRLGLGRAYIHVRDHGDEGLQGIILHHCLKNPCYDTQGEESRASWLMSVIDVCEDPTYYADKIVKELSIANDNRDLSQLYDLCLILAKRGNISAVSAIYVRFDKQEFNEAWLGGNHIIELHGLGGLTHVAKVLGKRMLEGDGYWDDSVYPHSCELYGKDMVDKHLEKLSAEDAEIALYLKNVLEVYKAWDKPSNINSPEKLRKRTREDLPLNKILHFIEEGKSHPSRCMRFGKHATDEEINIIYKGLLVEEREEQLVRYLWVFRRRELPEHHDKIFLFAHSDNEKLRGAAITALTHTSHSRVRNFAIKLHDADDVNHFIEAIELFVNNYQLGDYKYIERALIESEDTDALFSICYDLLKVFEEHPESGMQKCLLWIYENNPCAHCRSRAVELLLEHNVMPKNIHNECRYDCCEETKELFV